jgi:hypothetical protein
MAYATSNPPYLMSQAIGGKGKIWGYQSTDPTATVDSSSYVTNGWDLGIRANDIMILFDTTTGIISSLTCLTAVSTAVDFGNGTTIGTTTNSD